MPFIIYVFAVVADYLYNDGLARLYQKYVGMKKLRLSVAILSVYVVLCGLAISSTQVGDCGRLSTGVQATVAVINKELDVHNSQAVDSLKVTGRDVPAYFLPNFQLAFGNSRKVLSGLSTFSPEHPFVILHTVLDRVIIDEQFIHGGARLGYSNTRMTTRGLMDQCTPIFMVDVPFYKSLWYTVESNYSDSQLAFMIRHLEREPISSWVFMDISPVFR